MVLNQHHFTFIMKTLFPSSFRVSLTLAICWLLCSCASDNISEWETKNGKYRGAYEGGWWSGKTANGYGVWYSSDGYVTAGNWVNGKCGSNFTRETPSGDKFVGEMTSDCSAINGTVNYKNGDRYEGALSNGLPSGFGNLSKVNGEKYTGNFSNGKYSGTGSLIRPDGSKYVGNFSKGEFSGKGVLTHSNWAYDGDFENNMMNGKGVLTSQNFKFIGEFKNNHLYHVSQYSANGDLLSKGIWKANGSTWEQDTFLKSQAQIDQDSRIEAQRKEKEARESEQREASKRNDFWKVFGKYATCEEFDRARKKCSTAGDYTKCMQIIYASDYSVKSGRSLESSCGF